MREGSSKAHLVRCTVESVFVVVGIVMTILGAPNNAASTELEEAAKLSRESLERVADQVYEGKLSNGISVILYKRGIAPVFAGSVAVRVGGVDEAPGSTGISHLLEHMAFKGTAEIGARNIELEEKLMAREDSLRTLAQSRKLSLAEEKELSELVRELDTLGDGEALSEELSRRGATGLNATTSKELTTYFVNLPKSSLRFWAWLESARLFKPVFRQFYQERDVVMEERRMRYEDDPGGKLYEKLLATAFAVHPYRHPVIGYAEDIAKLTRPDLSAFHSKYYVPENVAISVVGDIEYEETLEILEEYFGTIPAGSPPQAPSEKEPAQQEERRVDVVHPSSPYLYLAYHKPSYPDPADAPISVLEEILAGSLVSPLYQELVKKRRLAASVSVFEAPGNMYPNLVLFSVVPRFPHTPEEVLAAFDEVIETVSQKGISADQLAIAKRSISVDFLGGLKSNSGLARQFVSSELLYGDWKSLVKWFDEAMAVSVDQVQDSLSRYLKPSNRTVAVLTPGEGEN